MSNPVAGQSKVSPTTRHSPTSIKPWAMPPQIIIIHAPSIIKYYPLIIIIKLNIHTKKNNHGKISQINLAREKIS